MHFGNCILVSIVKIQTESLGGSCDSFYLVNRKAQHAETWSVCALHSAASCCRSTEVY